MAVVLAGLMHGLDRDEVLAADWAPLSRLRRASPLHPAVAEIVAGRYRSRQLPEIKGAGWVIQSLEAALWAFHRAESFEEAVRRAVSGRLFFDS